MADRVKTYVSCTPIETLTDENGSTHDIVASEVGKSLGASGETINITDYSGVVETQGYANGAVGYMSITHSAGGTQVRTGATDFIYIKNTGYKYSSPTALGESTTDCVLITIRESAYENMADGGYVTGNGAAQLHFYELAWLKPGQGILLPLAAANLSISQFGSNTNDLSSIGQTSGYGNARIYARTYTSTGSAASSANAIEFLAVT